MIYQAQIDGDYWLPQVINDEDYAGIRGRNITGITFINRYRICSIQSIF